MNRRPSGNAATACAGKTRSENYNDGAAFKVTCRTEAGVIVTLIADNYYGYCKKEVKTQISYAANLYGNVEEEHAGGAIAFTSYSFGDEYQTDSRKVNGRTFADVVRDYGSIMDVKPEGYGIDKTLPDLIYIPDDARASIARQQIWWTWKGREQSIPMLPGNVYMTPSGFKVRMEKHPGAPSWRIIGTSGEGTFCHKPCTVSGGGKSEISKSAPRLHALRAASSSPMWRRIWTSSSQIFNKRLRRSLEIGCAGEAGLCRRGQPADPQQRALAGQRDQAADAVTRIHR